MRKAVFTAAVGAAALLAAGMVCLLLWQEGIFLPNRPSKEQFPVRGVDVSAHQGEIDWPVLAGQDLSFAFVKATEGSSFTDAQFAENWEEARSSGLRVGAYHFFSFDSSGESQAAHFIKTVPKREGDLPPVVDVEFYGDKEQNPPSREEVEARLVPLLIRLTEHYGVKPILYSTGKAYKRYLAGGYEEYDIWIRDVFFTPSLPDGREYAFWQYTDKGRLPGYQGDEKCIDLNVFCGTEEEFRRYGAQP